MKRTISSLFLLCLSLSGRAQVAQSDELAFRIKAEALEHSRIPELSSFMTDKLGSRLMASQMGLRAEGLVVDKLTELGLSNSRVEKAMNFGPGGWDNEKSYAAMTAPYYCAFAVNPKAWSGSTDGSKMIDEEKPLCVVTGSGSYNIPSSDWVSYKYGNPEPVPEIVLPIEDHNRMCRLVLSGEKVEMEVEIRNKFSDNRQINNVLAEIPGTDRKLKDEIVLIGAHLDSWHGSTGAADNAAGCIVMMEAMRIIKALGIQPKRTIRIALWGGEELGCIGSAGYLKSYIYDKENKQALPGYDNFALYLNMDNGSGRFRGIYLEKNDMAFPYFREWMKAIEPLGFTTLSPRPTYSTDHITFNEVGLPAFQFIQDVLEYRRTYHTIMDTYERLSFDDLKIDAAITAWLVICAANDPGRIPAKPVL